jgi:hypothetical protein
LEQLGPFYCNRLCFLNLFEPCAESPPALPGQFSRGTAERGCARGLRLGNNTFRLWANGTAQCMSQLR